MKFEIELPNGIDLIELPKFGHLRIAKPAEEGHGCKGDCSGNCKNNCSEDCKGECAGKKVDPLAGQSTVAVIGDLIDRKRAEALKDHPREKFNSLHEAYAILLEETEEADEEISWLQENLDDLWEAVRFDEFDESKSSFETIYGAGINAILELLQVCAVCRKALESGLWQ